MRKPVIEPEGRVHIHLIVSDMKASIDFYVTVLGFNYDHGMADMAWLTWKELLLTLSPGEPPAQTNGYFGYSVESIERLEELYARLHARHLRLSHPPDLNEGRAYFFLYDPDDYPIAFSASTLEHA